MKQKLNIRLICNVFSLLLCLFLLISVMFAWYTHNTEVSANGISAVTDDSNSIIIESTVYTKRENLDGSIIESEYQLEKSGKMTLTKRTITKEENTNDVDISGIENKSFYIETMLPGEYIDITFGFSLKEELDGKNFKIKLNDVYGNSSFKVNNKYHYAPGAFKYQSISLKDDSGNELYSEDTEIIDSDSKSNFKNYQWFSEYKIDVDDINHFDINLLNGVWDKNYVKLHYTFRIMEDFTQYYALMSKATYEDEETNTGALLSNKNLIIKQVYFMLG